MKKKFYFEKFGNEQSIAFHFKVKYKIIYKNKKQLLSKNCNNSYQTLKLFYLWVIKICRLASQFLYYDTGNEQSIGIG